MSKYPLLLRFTTHRLVFENCRLLSIWEFTYYEDGQTRFL